MKKALLFGVFVCSACGPGEDGIDGAPGESCTVAAVDGGALISCPDGTEQVIAHGVDGTNGSNGADGADGANGSDGADGQDGENGSNGADGADGSNGQDGTDNHIVSRYFCTTLLGDTPGLSFFYDAFVFSTGDVAVHGGVFGEQQENSTSTHYAADNPGAAVAGVSFVYDWLGAANGGWWQIHLDRANLATTVTYNDADIVGGAAFTWAPAPSECSVSQY